MGTTYYPKDILSGLTCPITYGDHVMIPFCENGMSTIIKATVCDGSDFFPGDGMYLSFINDDENKVYKAEDTQLHFQAFSCRKVIPRDGVLYVKTPDGSYTEIQYPASTSEELLRLLKLLVGRCTAFEYCAIKNKKYLEFDEFILKKHQSADTSVFWDYYEDIKNKRIEGPNVLSLFGYGKFQTNNWCAYELTNHTGGRKTIVYERTMVPDLVRFKYSVLIPALVVERKKTVLEYGGLLPELIEVGHDALINRVPFNRVKGWYSPFENITSTRNTCGRQLSTNTLSDNDHIPLSTSVDCSTVESTLNDIIHGISERFAHTEIYPTQSTEATIAESTPKTPQPKIETKKEKPMDTKTTLIDSNKDAAFLAAQIEAGRLSTTIITKMITPHLPPFLMGYANHPIAALMLANMAIFGAEQFRPGDERAKAIAKAMQISAYTELFKSFNLEELISNVFDEISDKVNLPGMPALPKPGKTTK